MLLTFHFYFYFYFLKFTNFSPLPHTSSESIFAPIVVYILISILGLFIPGDLIYACYKNKKNVSLLNKTVEEGTRPGVEISEDELVPRPEVMEHFKKILQPRRNQSLYHVICGEHGTGKTTLTRKASREVGQGVIYVEIPADAEDIEDFGIAFGASLNFAFEERISFTSQLMKKILGDTNGELIIIILTTEAFEAFDPSVSLYR